MCKNQNLKRISSDSFAILQFNNCFFLFTVDVIIITIAVVLGYLESKFGRLNSSRSFINTIFKSFGLFFISFILFAFVMDFEERQHFLS